MSIDLSLNLFNSFRKTHLFESFATTSAGTAESTTTRRRRRSVAQAASSKSSARPRASKRSSKS